MASSQKRSFSLLDIPRPTKTYHTKTYDRISPSKTPFNAAGKTVLVTGGASGVGYSISRAFAEAGVARLIIVSRSAGPQATAKESLSKEYPNVQIETHSQAITDEAATKTLLETIGPVDVLVLCAGVAHKQAGKSTDLPFEDIWSCFETNVKGNFQTSLQYIAQPGPAEKTIIYVSSISAQLTFPRQIGYNTSKAAFTNIAQHLAAEYASDGVRVFAFHPGAHYTPGTSPHYTPDMMEWDDIALPGDFSVWLASQESSHLSGRFLWCHWDVDELIALKERAEKDNLFLKIGLQQ